MPTYEKWNEDNTVLLSTIIDPDALKLSKMQGKGYLLVVEPVVDPATEKKGIKTFLTSTRSWEVIPLSQGELDDYQAAQEANAIREANEALLEVLQASTGLSFWVDKTDEEIDTLIDSTPSTIAGLKGTDKKIAHAVSDIVKILKVLKDTGRIF